MQPPMQPPITYVGAPPINRAEIDPRLLSPTVDMRVQPPQMVPEFDIRALLAMLGNQSAPGMLSAPPAQMPARMRDNLFQRYGIPAASPAQLYR